MLIREFHKKPENSSQNILQYALVDWALKQQVTDEDSARQLLYLYYRGNLQQPFRNLLAKNIREDNVFNGFTSGGSFEPEAIADVLRLFESNEGLKEHAVMLSKLSKINEFFGVTGSKPDLRMKQYEATRTLVDQYEAENGKEPRPTIETRLFFDLITDPELFSCYIAVRSVEGQKTFVATNRPTIAGRMAGYKSPLELPSGNEIFTKYSTRYHFNRIINSLCERELIKSILRKQKWSRFYVSTKLTPVELGKVVGSRLLKNAVKRKNDEAMKSLQQVYNTTSI